MTKSLPARFRTCLRCGKDFQIGTTRAKFCSAACRNAAFIADKPGYMVDAQRRYVARHLEKKRTYMAAYRDRPGIRARAEERRRARYQANPDRVKAYVRARRAGYAVGHTDAEWRALVATYKGRCAYCGEKRRLTKDHITPIAHGDPATVDLIANIVPACRSCNSRKHTKAPPTFQPTLESLDAQEQAA